jgi:hypothetical protein
VYGLLPVPDGTTAVALMTILLFTLATSCVGWCTRLSLIVATVTFTWLNMLDSLSTMTKYSVIASHGLLLLSMSHCGTIWSLDSLLKRRSATPSESLELKAFPVWPRRLMQCLMGMVYLGAAFTKMHDPAFLSSDQMRNWMMTNVNHSNPIGEWLSFYPAALVVSAYITIIWEVLFIFLAWRGFARPVMLTLGVCFHLGTTVLLGLYVFPLVCFSIYLSFVEQRDIDRLKSWLVRLREGGNGLLIAFHNAAGSILSRVPKVSPQQAGLVFGVGLLACVFGGVELEHQLDVFGVRRAEGAHQLRELDPAQVSRMLRGSERIREEDKYLSFDIGTDLLGGVLRDHQDAFVHGDTLVAQCTLIPPHEDMWIECNLHDSDGRLIDRVGQVVSRTTLRATYAFDLMEALDPGTYFLVVQSSGREITRRPFTLNRRVEK